MGNSWIDYRANSSSRNSSTASPYAMESVSGHYAAAMGKMSDHYAAAMGKMSDHFDAMGGMSGHHAAMKPWIRHVQEALAGNSAWKPMLEHLKEELLDNHTSWKPVLRHLQEELSGNQTAWIELIQHLKQGLTGDYNDWKALSDYIKELLRDRYSTEEPWYNFTGSTEVYDSTGEPRNYDTMPGPVNKTTLVTLLEEARGYMRELPEEVYELSMSCPSGPLDDARVLDLVKKVKRPLRKILETVRTQDCTDSQDTDEDLVRVKRAIRKLTAAAEELRCL